MNPFDEYTEAYEAWFHEHKVLFQSELLALKQLIPEGEKGAEIGIGSGIFAAQLGIRYGVDPSSRMLAYARQRGLNVSEGIAEALPYADESFDFVAFITSICFINDPARALAEARRVVKKGGAIIVAFIDRESSLGQSLDAGKAGSRFYGSARFYSTAEMICLLNDAQFETEEIVQTLANMNLTVPEQPLPGYGRGGFVVIRAGRR